MNAQPSIVTQLLDMPADLLSGSDDSDQTDPFFWNETAETAAAPASNLTVMPKRSLGAHVNAVDAIARVIEELDDEQLTAEVREELSHALIEQLAGTRAKVDSTSRVLAMFEGLEAAAAAERERLEKREAYFARQIKRLETYVLAILEASRLDRIEGDTSTLLIRKNPPAVVIDDSALIPIEFKRIPPPPAAAPDKVAIKKAINAGFVVAGARLEQGRRLERI